MLLPLALGFALVLSLAWLIYLAAQDFKRSHSSPFRRLGYETCEGRIVLTPIASVARDANESGQITATIQLNMMAMQAGSVDLTVVGLTATAGDDFYIQGGPPGVYTKTVNFAQWDMVKTVVIGLVNDTLFEGNETLRFDLSNPVNLTVSPTAGSDPATIIDNDVNYPPQATAIPDQYRWTEDENEIVISLGTHFSDQNDALSSLTWSVTPTGESGLTSYSVDSCQFLHLGFETGTAGISNVRVRGTDPHGAYAETDFDSYSVVVSDFDLERNTDSGWVTVDPASEVVWDDDELRWTAHIDPDVPSIAVGTDWLASPWPGEYYTGGTSFAGASGLQVATGNPGMGHHAITPRVPVAEREGSVLAAPREVIVASIVSVKWKQYDYGDGHTDLVVGGNSLTHGGDLIYAEKQVPDAAGVVHDKIDVEVTIAWGGGARPATNVFLKVFDPDHDSTDVAFDTDGDSPEDNVMQGGNESIPGAALDDGTMPFAPTVTTNTVTMTIAHRRPGNNFIVATSGRTERINHHVDFSDGTTLWDDVALAQVAEHRKTHILTVCAHASCGRGFDGAPDYEDETFGADDIDPGNLGGTTGVDNFVEPSLAFLTAEFAKAHVRVVSIGNHDDIMFIRNLEEEDVAYGNGVRDVPTQPNYWTIQVLAAYEGPAASDGDDGDAEVTGGNTSTFGESPVNIFLEALAEANSMIPNAVDTERLRQRTVLHEVMHRFGHLDHDVAVMSYSLLWTAPDNQVELVGLLFQKIRSNNPR